MPNTDNSDLGSRIVVHKGFRTWVTIREKTIGLVHPLKILRYLTDVKASDPFEFAPPV